MLKIQGLCKRFNKGTLNETILFNNFDLEIKNRDFVTIIGSNGAGKSTLLNIISGTISADSGSIFLNGEDVTTIEEYKRTKYIGRVFQNPSMGVAPNMTILENMSLAYNKGKKYNLTFCIDKNNIVKFKEILSEINLGLENKLYTKVGLLSGGQRQVLSLVMAVMSNPKLLLLDEHIAALDPKTSERIIEITNNIVMRNKITTIMVSHNLNHAIKMGNRLLMLHEGRIVMDFRDEEKKNLSINKLLRYFENIQSKDILSDKILFG
ncbi:ABC transporter ATP-binding protein [Caloramator sp. ALD01]|uniref:ABC transporter ATP-binding protein n=1 Tax=Caloramator sp. ALD01 TaxID=1031288 RepID=UPI00047FA6CF|nr:ATP-binding cassette domain-containing protein [Caloramator sp. ALD01]